MNTSAARPLLVTAGLLAAAFALTHGMTWSLSGFFGPMRERATDRLFAARSAFPALRPPDDGRVVHIVVDDASLEQRDAFYFSREDHARLVRSLDRAGVAVQFHDVIFAAQQTEQGDRELELATAAAERVYYGMGLGLSLDSGETDPTSARRIDARPDYRQSWPCPTGAGEAFEFPRPTWYFPTYPELAAEARGVAFLDVIPDRDGVYRDAILFARDGERLYPSAAMRVVSDFLDVDPARIRFGPGQTVTLAGARFPDSDEVRDIVIPVDRRARMVVNYLGPWGAMKSYPLATIDEASTDRFTMEDLRDELEGKIAVVSWFATGAEDIGPVPVDPIFPRAGIHATVMNNILTGSFMRELSAWQMVGWVELPLLLLLLVAAVWLSTGRFVAVAVGAAILYGVLAVVAFVWGKLILDIPGPLLLIFHGTVLVASRRYLAEAQVRARLDRDMAVARDIQMRTFPGKMPTLAGYEVAGRSDPAEETGGDTFDVISLDDERLLLLLGDATGHGLGPALSVTQVRSMLRIAMRLGADLDASFKQINDQLSDDLASNRFVTAFLGILDAGSNAVTYHAAGQGPLMYYKAATGEFEWLDSTTTPMGLMEHFVPATGAALVLEPGDMLGLMTDGIFEYENRAGEQFGTDRVAAILREHYDDPAERLVERLFDSVREYGRGVPQADDITILLLRRTPV